MDAHRRTNFTPPRLAERQRLRAAGRKERGVFAYLIAVFGVLGVGMVLLAVAGMIARSSTTPSLSLDSAANDVIDVLLPSAFSGGSDEPVAQGPSVQAFTPTPAPSPSPTPASTLNPATVQGSPLSLQSLVSAWEAEAMKATALLADSETYPGFAHAPAYIQLKNNGRTMEVAAFIYPNRESVRDDWNAPTGERPSPKDGRSLPGHQSLWWNKNTVVVVLTDPDGLSSTARNAYFDAR